MRWGELVDVRVRTKWLSPYDGHFRIRMVSGQKPSLPCNRTWIRSRFSSSIPKGDLWARVRPGRRHGFKVPSQWGPYGTQRGWRSIGVGLSKTADSSGDLGSTPTKRTFGKAPLGKGLDFNNIPRRLNLCPRRIALQLCLVKVVPD